MRHLLSMFATHIVLLFVLIGSIVMIFDLHRFAFLGELLVLGVLLLFAIVAIVGIVNYFLWVWKFLLGYYILIFLNLLFIYSITSVDLYLFRLVFYMAIVGFVIALLNVFAGEKRHKRHRLHEEESPIVEQASVTPAKKVSTTHSPGKYLASKSGNTYHVPKCDWGKRINKKNRVWFDSKAEAERDGNKPHNCIN